MFGVKCPEMSANVVWLIGGTRDRCGQTKKRIRMARRSSATLNEVLLPSISHYQNLSLSKQEAAARGLVTPDLASSHPSVNGANLHAAQLRTFALREIARVNTRGVNILPLNLKVSHTRTVRVARQDTAGGVFRF